MIYRFLGRSRVTETGWNGHRWCTKLTAAGALLLGSMSGAHGETPRFGSAVDTRPAAKASPAVTVTPVSPVTPTATVTPVPIRPASLPEPTVPAASAPALLGVPNDSAKPISTRRNGLREPSAAVELSIGDLPAQESAADSTANLAARETKLAAMAATKSMPTTNYAGQANRPAAIGQHPSGQPMSVLVPGGHAPLAPTSVAQGSGASSRRVQDKPAAQPGSSPAIAAAPGLLTPPTATPISGRSITAMPIAVRPADAAVTPAAAPIAATKGPSEELVIGDLPSSPAAIAPVDPQAKPLPSVLATGVPATSAPAPWRNMAIITSGKAVAGTEIIAKQNSAAEKIASQDTADKPAPNAAIASQPAPSAPARLTSTATAGSPNEPKSLSSRRVGDEPRAAANPTPIAIAGAVPGAVPSAASPPLASRPVYAPSTVTATAPSTASTDKPTIAKTEPAAAPITAASTAAAPLATTPIVEAKPTNVARTETKQDETKQPEPAKTIATRPATYDPRETSLHSYLRDVRSRTPEADKVTPAPIGTNHSLAALKHGVKVPSESTATQPTAAQPTTTQPTVPQPAAPATTVAQAPAATLPPTTLPVATQPAATQPIATLPPPTLLPPPTMPSVTMPSDKLVASAPAASVPDTQTPVATAPAAQAPATQAPAAYVPEHAPIAFNPVAMPAEAAPTRFAPAPASPAGSSPSTIYPAAMAQTSHAPHSAAQAAAMPASTTPSSNFPANASPTNRVPAAAPAAAPAVMPMSVLEANRGKFAGFNTPAPPIAAQAPVAAPKPAAPEITPEEARIAASEVQRMPGGLLVEQELPSPIARGGFAYSGKVGSPIPATAPVTLPGPTAHSPRTLPANDSATQIHRPGESAANATQQQPNRQPQPAPSHGAYPDPTAAAPASGHPQGMPSQVQPVAGAQTLTPNYQGAASFRPIRPRPMPTQAQGTEQPQYPTNPMANAPMANPAAYPGGSSTPTALLEEVPSELTPPAPSGKLFEEIDQSGEMTVILRRSKLLRTKADIFRTAVVDPSICDVIQFTPREVSIIGRGQGATHVTFWFRDGASKPVTYLVKVTPDPSIRVQLEDQYKILQEVVTELFPNSKVKLIPVADKLIVKGQAKDAEEAAQIMAIIRGQAGGRGGDNARGYGGNLVEGSAANVLSAEETGRQISSRTQVVNMLRIPGVQQVALRVKIAELNRTAARGFGVDVRARIDFGGSSNLFLESMLNVVNGGAPALIANLDGNDINIGIRYLQKHGVLRILSEPTLVTLSGKPATFVAGGEFAVPTIVGVGGASGITTDFRSFGVIISFMPTVLDKDRIRLDVSPEFSQINADLAVGQTPGLNVRAVTTTVEMREGQTLAIAGLLDDQMKADTTGDLPLLAQIFGRRNVSRSETELIILVTPELVHPMEPEEVPPLPGFDVTEPTNHEFFIHGKIEGLPTQEYRSTVWPRLQQRYRAGGPAMTSGPFGHGQ